MKPEYDFGNGKRGPVVRQKGKTRITIYIDDEVLKDFRRKAEEAGQGYQTMINEVLREHLGHSTRPVDEETLRRVIREEVTKFAK